MCCAPGGWRASAASTCRIRRAPPILTALGCAVENLAGGDLSVEPPSWRGDIEGEADLVEEVLRVKGYDQIPAVPLVARRRCRVRHWRRRSDARSWSAVPSPDGA